MMDGYAGRICDGRIIMLNVYDGRIQWTDMMDVYDGPV